MLSDWTQFDSAALQTAKVVCEMHCFDKHHKCWRDIVEEPISCTVITPANKDVRNGGYFVTDPVESVVVS